MQPPSFAHRREAECLAIATAINPGLAANPVLLPSLAKYTEHPQSSCLLFLFLPLFLSLLCSLCILTHRIMLSVHPACFLQVLLFSLLSIPQERCSGYTAGLGVCLLLLHIHLLHPELQEGLPHSLFSSENSIPFPKAGCGHYSPKTVALYSAVPTWAHSAILTTALTLCPPPNSLWFH